MTRMSVLILFMVFCVSVLDRPLLGAALAAVLLGQGNGLHPLHRKPAVVSYTFLRVGEQARKFQVRQGSRRGLPVTGRRRMLVGS